MSMQDKVVLISCVSRRSPAERSVEPHILSLEADLSIDLTAHTAGANRGIGLAAVKLFLEEGAKVVASDLKINDAEKELGGNSDKILFMETDVTKEDQVEEMCKAALTKFGSVDSAILNAGVLSGISEWIHTDAKSLDLMTEVNVKGPWITAKYAVRSMLESAHKGKGCSLVFVASVASLYGQPGMSGYNASKWAVRGLSLTAAQEFAPYGIRSNCIQPGATDTHMFNMFPDELQTQVKGSNTANRAASTLEIAQAMLFFASDKSSFCNGSTLAVHAGQTPT